MIDPNEAKPTPIQNTNVLAAYQAQCAAPPPPVVDDVRLPVDPALEKKLRALGYLEQPASPRSGAEDSFAP